MNLGINVIAFALISGAALPGHAQLSTFRALAAVHSERSPQSDQGSPFNYGA